MTGLTLLVLACINAAQAPQWPEQLLDPGWKPHIGYLREATGIDGQSLVGPRLRWSVEGKTVDWTLVNPPSGMEIDGLGRIVWQVPKEGRYLVRVRARHDGETEEADWYLNVIKTRFPDPVIFSTRHMDYLVPRDYADWLRTSGASGVIDRYYEFGRDLVGGYPSDTRQSLLHDTSIWGAHSGDPIVAGRVPLGDNDANHWRLGFLFHELGHDLNAWTRVGYIEHGDKVADTVLHDMVEFDKIAWVTRMLKDPDKQGAVNAPKFAEWMKAESMEFVDAYQKYIEQYNNGGQSFLDYHDGDSAVWAGMVHEYAFTYGNEPLERVIRAIRNDGIDLLDYPSMPLPATERLTIVMCLMSAATGHDLEKQFRDMGFPLKGAVFNRMKPIVAKVMANLPALGKKGFIRCPLDGHYYSTTPYHTTWAVAESTARRMGGHLATLRSAEQEQWLANRFANDGWLWIGARRFTSNSDWRWVTQESTGNPIWEPERPETDPAKTCGVLIYHNDPGRGPWFGMANRPPNENLIGIIELTHEPAIDVDDLS